MLAETLLSLLPKTESELIQFQKTIEKSCKEFDSRLSALGLSSATMMSNTPPHGNGLTGLHIRNSSASSSSSNSSSSNAPCLGDMIGACNAHFATVRRRELLSCARDLIISDYHNTMLAAGDALEVSYGSHFSSDSIQYLILNNIQLIRLVVSLVMTCID